MSLAEAWLLVAEGDPGSGPSSVSYALLFRGQSQHSKCLRGVRWQSFSVMTPFKSPWLVFVWQTFLDASVVWARWLWARHHSTGDRGPQLSLVCAWPPCGLRKAVLWVVLWKEETPTGG